MRLAMPILLAGTRRAGQRARRRAQPEPRRHDADVGASPPPWVAWATGIPLLGLLIAVLAVLPIALLQALAQRDAARQPDRQWASASTSWCSAARRSLYREFLGSRSRVRSPGSSTLEAAVARATCRSSGRRCSSRRADLRSPSAGGGGDMGAARTPRSAWPCTAAGAEPVALDKSGGLGARACATARCCSPARCRRSAAHSCRSATSTRLPKA